MAKPQLQTVPAVTTTELEQHPLALQISPGSMSDSEFEALCADLTRQGQKLPITLYEGKVLDGIHRYRACIRQGLTPVTVEYTGNDPAGLIIALNVLRRKMGSTQRALAGARLNLDYDITQDEAAKRVGVSKVHVNLVVQALKSKNARLIKLLENPDFTREALHEELVECGVIKAGAGVVSMAMKNSPTPAAALAANAGGLQGFFNSLGASDPDEDLLGEASESSFDEELGDMLGDPPSAGGKVLNGPTRATTDGGMPLVGSKPSHPERRSRDTPAYQLAEKFKGMSEGDRISFIQIAWPVMRPLLKVAGVSVDPPAGSPAAVADAAIDKAAQESKVEVEAPEAPKPTKARKSKAV